MARFAALMIVALSLSVACRAKGMRDPINGNPVQPSAQTQGDTSTVNNSGLPAPVACKADEVMDNGKCVAPPPKCKKEEVYLAYLDQCVANTPENTCFSKGQVLLNGACANHTYYAACILKTGRSAAQDNILAQLKLVAADTTCEGSYTKLSQLTKLDISDKKQDLDLRLISDFTGLEELSVEKNLLTTAAGLEKLKDLEKLNLSDNLIANITALTGLTNLEELDLETNKIKDITSLRTLTRLRDLDISKNDVTALTALTNMSSLRKLDVHKNDNLQDLRPLRNLQQLESLNIEDTEVDNLGPLRDLFLLELKISGSDIAGFLPDELTESTCPVDTATSAVLFDACSLLRGI